MSVDTNLTNLKPVAPWFARRSGADGSQVKFTGAEAAYEDIVRRPTGVVSAGAVSAFDVPVTIRRHRIELSSVLVTVTAATDFAGVAIANLPDRNILILQAELVGSAVFSGDYANDDDPVIGVGTAVAAANPIATTAVNVIPATTLTNIVKDAATPVAASFVGSTGAISGLLVADTATTQLFFNVSSPDTQLAADGTCRFTGTLDIWYVDLGNVGS